MANWREIMYGRQYADLQDSEQTEQTTESAPSGTAVDGSLRSFPAVEPPPGERANPAAGWYPDPSDHEKHRYWDGRRWIKPKPTGRANRLAVTALICSCVAGVVIGGVLGIVFGVVALDEIRESDGKERGEGMAQWAIGLGVLNLVLSITVVALFIVSLSSTP